MLQGCPAPFMTPALQPTQQLLSLKVLQGQEQKQTSGRRMGGGKE